MRSNNGWDMKHENERQAKPGPHDKRHIQVQTYQRAVLLVNKRNGTKRFKTCTQLWQISSQAKMWPVTEKQNRQLLLQCPNVIPYSQMQECVVTVLLYINPYDTYDIASEGIERMYMLSRFMSYLNVEHWLYQSHLLL